MTIEVFVSYSHRDEEYVNPDSPRSLIAFMGKLDGLRFWYDRNIAVGNLWNSEIQERIARSHIALVLVSQWFLKSPYVQRSEIPRFLSKRKKDGMVIIPIILGACDWRRHRWLAATQHLPEGNETIREHYTRRAKRERLYLRIEQELRRQSGRLTHRTRDRGPGTGHETRSAQQSPAHNDKKRSGIGTHVEAFGAVEKFVEEGDHVSAINRILGGRNFVDAPPEDQMDITVIYQKLGLLERARSYINLILSSSRWSLASPEFRARIQLLNIKILSQEGSFAELLQRYQDIAGDLLLTKQEERICQVLHRAGVAYAVTGNAAASDRCFQESFVYAAQNGNRHAEITIGVLRSIAQFFRGLPAIGEDPLEVVKRAQEAYLSEPTETSLWQANRLKSAVQSLFAEAAMLMAGRAEPSGWIRLTAAHLLGPRARSHPNSEGYAELLSLVDRVEIRNALRLAMSTVNEERDEFQRKYLDHTPYLSECQSVFDILATPTLSRWRRLRLLFQRADQRYRRS